MKTDIILKVNMGGYRESRIEYCRIKLDANKFPYIVIDNEKVIISSAEFPRIITICYGLIDLHIELVSGKEELEAILSNPDLTADKLSLKQQMRLG